MAASILDRFIPADVPVGSEQHLRARIMCAILLFNVAFFPIGELLVYFFRSQPQGYLSRGHLVVALVSGCAATVLYLYKRHGWHQLLGNWFIASCYISVVYPVVRISGSPEIVIQSFYVLPAIAAMICGLGTAIIWTVLVATTHVYFLHVLRESQEVLPFDTGVTLMIYIVLLISFSIHRSVQDRVRAEINHDRKILDYEAHHDNLTQLTNRKGAQQALDLWMSSAELTGDSLGLLFIDLDKFKPVNDELGHAAGDKVLQVAAQRLKASTRGGDLACRVGGDEFVVLLQGLKDMDGALVAANNILRALREPMQLEDTTFQISASIGIALFPQHGRSPEELWKFADEAMYRAKNKDQGVALHTELKAVQ